MTAPLLLVTEVHTMPHTLPEVLGRWGAGGVRYQALEGASVLELTPLSGLAELDEAIEAWDARYEAVRPLLVRDVRRQVVRFVEAPKPVDGDLPDTPYLQLRHVEVRPPVYREYLAWREETIFAEVAKADVVAGFLAYHSLLSTEPGVLFVSGFSCPPEEYLPVFASDRYAEIARQAHERYITEDGLYTRVYRRVET